MAYETLIVEIEDAIPLNRPTQPAAPKAHNPPMIQEHAGEQVAVDRTHGVPFYVLHEPDECLGDGGGVGDSGRGRLGVRRRWGGD